MTHHNDTHEANTKTRKRVFVSHAQVLPERIYKDYTLHRLEERIIIYADRLVDIITDGIVPIRTEQEAEERFEDILQSVPKYGKNDPTLARYLNYHREIQGLMRR